MTQFGQVMSTSFTDALGACRFSQTAGPNAHESEPKTNPPTEFDDASCRKFKTYIAKCKIMFATSL
jgi:hypothetical protein